MKEQPNDSARQKKIASVFKKLEKATQEHLKETQQAANTQNAIVLTCMYTGPEKQKQYRSATSRFERCKFTHSIYKHLMNIFLKYRDDKGNFTNYEELYGALEKMSKTASTINESEVVEIVDAWKNQLPIPKKA